MAVLPKNITVEKIEELAKIFPRGKVVIQEC